jgi:hypothetical protein
VTIIGQDSVVGTFYFTFTFFYPGAG